jgi:hypothetical protein
MIGNAEMVLQGVERLRGTRYDNYRLDSLAREAYLTKKRYENDFFEAMEYKNRKAL